MEKGKRVRGLVLAAGEPAEDDGVLLREVVLAEGACVTVAEREPGVPRRGAER